MTTQIENEYQIQTYKAVSKVRKSVNWLQKQVTFKYRQFIAGYA